MLYLNISSDKVLLNNNKKNLFLDRNNLERTFCVALKAIYDEKFIDKIFVLNGPGSFTSLRVGTLSLNLLNFLYNNKIDIYSISKIDLYKKFVDNGFLPSKGLIFIGQQKNLWLYDFQANDYKQVSIPEVAEIKDDYFIDQIFGDLLNILDNNKIINLNLDMKNQEINISFNNKSSKLNISNLDLKPSFEVFPNYMIAPNIS